MASKQIAMHKRNVLFHAMRCILGRNITSENIDRLFKTYREFLSDDCNASKSALADVKSMLLDQCGDYIDRFPNPGGRGSQTRKTTYIATEIQMLILDMMGDTGGDFHSFSPAYIRGFGPITEWLQKLKIHAIIIDFDKHPPVLLPFKNDYQIRKDVLQYMWTTGCHVDDHPRVSFYYDMNKILETGFYGTDPNHLVVPERFHPISVLPPIRSSQGDYNYDRYE